MWVRFLLPLPIYLNIKMAVVAKWLTHRIVIPAFGGSIPLVRPLLFIKFQIQCTNNVAVVAKWLTHRIVIPAFGGSIPLVRPSIIGV